MQITGTGRFQKRLYFLIFFRDSEICTVHEGLPWTLDVLLRFALTSCGEHQNVEGWVVRRVQFVIRDEKGRAPRNQVVGGWALCDLLACLNCCGEWSTLMRRNDRLSYLIIFPIGTFLLLLMDFLVFPWTRRARWCRVVFGKRIFAGC